LVIAKKTSAVFNPVELKGGGIAQAAKTLVGLN